MSLRPVKQIIQPKPTIEGAKVRLQRAFGKKHRRSLKRLSCG